MDFSKYQLRFAIHSIVILFDTYLKNTPANYLFQILSALEFSLLHSFNLPWTQ